MIIMKLEKLIKIFIKRQNNEIKDILDIKINVGIFNSSCRNKINVQQIKEEDIFTLNQSSFIDILYNFSYRKIIEENFEKYNSFKINLLAIEDKNIEL